MNIENDYADFSDVLITTTTPYFIMRQRQGKENTCLIALKYDKYI